MLTATRKVKKCKHCRTEFTPARLMQVVCSIDCAREMAFAVNARKQAAQARAERKDDRTRRERMKSIPQLTAEAQREFNSFIRERDRQAGHACISSGRPLDWSGNGVDAGHYRSVGAASHLRFDERNCHAQSKHDNQYKSGNAVDYRIGLIARIGLAAVEALEADNAPRKWTRDELRGIKATYSAKRRALLKQGETQ
jgi:hypothetical protein